MRNIGLMLITRALPLGIAGADVHAASNQVTQIKVCLTSIGWCTDYTLARSTQTTACYCQHHQQTPGHITPGFSHRSHTSTEAEETLI